MSFQLGRRLSSTFRPYFSKIPYSFATMSGAQSFIGRNPIRRVFVRVFRTTLSDPGFEVFIFSFKKFAVLTSTFRLFVIMFWSSPASASACVAQICLSDVGAWLFPGKNFGRQRQGYRAGQSVSPS